MMLEDNIGGEKLPENNVVSMEGRKKKKKNKRRTTIIPEDKKITSIVSDSLVEKVGLSEEKKNKQIAGLITTKSTLLNRIARIQSSIRALNSEDSAQKITLEMDIEGVNEMIKEINQELKKLGFIDEEK